MKRFLQTFLWLVILLGLAATADGQSRSKKKEHEKTGIEKYLPTENTSFTSRDMPNDLPEKEDYKLIYKSDPAGTLYGNPCAYQATHDFGFEYIIEPDWGGGPTSKSRMGKSLNNFWVKTKLVFTKGPFWKSTLNKKLRECRRVSGDIVG